ncbi:MULTISPECIES: hypothetical protein [Entomomonas]|uniref:Uncharacterized protein n=1 Tax=Entomomonas asaccharolytica TaxID=2785331 RepID=A0A974NHA9_9GAMM|nr:MULTISPECIES: hypothetical protein [Entomomonas]QQP86820.1 hypothetical protein JHT90_06155 [Entomomonas asaccharolytica]UYZ83562.1 hypothetical protein MTZ49_13300 [Entomomonas sp. E2T0]
MKKDKQPITPAERMKAKRLREKELHQRLGGKEKRIHLYNYSVEHIKTIMEKCDYSCEDEAIVDALAVATQVVLQNEADFNNYLSMSRKK